MLSVLIVDNKILDHYNKYDYFFGYFEAHKDVAVCAWNKQSMDGDIAASVPQLMEAIRNAPEWNAYVICEPHNSIEYLKGDFENQTQYSINPYERANHEGYNREEDRLLNLLYFLGGRGNDDMKYIKQYQFRAARPNNIYIITPRILKNIEQQKHFLLSELREKYLGVLDDPARILAGEIDVTRNYSEFWERYEYPANCRFMVYDFPEEKHQTYQESWFAFWITVISMTQNRFNNAVLAPFKLHILNIEVSDSKFAEYVNRFYTMLLENKELNEYLINKETELEKAESANTDITVSEAATPVYVNFPHVNVGDLFATDKNIGLVKDRPVLDEDDWFCQMRRTKENIVKFFKAIVRGKSEAVDFVHEDFANELPELKGKHITKYDIEELKEAINNHELEMVSLDLAFKGSRAEFEKKQEKADKMVRTYMRRRLRFKIAAWLTGACMLIYFLGFLPYLINSISHSVTSFLFALPISMGAILVPLVCSIIMLFILKKRMKQTIELYNAVIIGCYNDVTKSSELQGEYLTHLLDYMKKYQILAMAVSGNTHSEMIEKLILSNVIFEDAISECTALATNNNIAITKITDRYIENVIDSMPESRIYLYEENVGGRMAFNTSRDALDAPFAFTEQLLIECEELYECEAYGGFENSPTEEAPISDDASASEEGSSDNNAVAVPTDLGSTDSAVSTDSNNEEVTE